MKLQDQINSKQIKAILFDMDGTLYSSNAKVEHQIISSMQTTACEFLNIDRSEAIKLLQKYRKMYKSSVLGLEKHHSINPYEFYDNVYNRLDISKMEKYPDMDITLKSLSKLCPIFLMTNSNRGFTDRTLEKLNLKNTFEETFTVEDNYFLRKPNIEVYQNIINNKLSLEFSEIAMFDDIASSLKVISNEGSTTILVGNGLLPPPSFIDLHTREVFNKAPNFVDYSTHDIVSFIKKYLI
tara:strand:- start:4398 stop:5114 length:717 start_codon:yes stop_codon:yes gene_type:complete